MPYLTPSRKLCFSFSLVITVLLISFTQPALAQQNDKESVSGNSSLIFESGLGGTLYQDPLTGQAMQTINSSEMMVDKTTYQLGPSDVISVTINANQQFTYRGLFVNPQGDIFIPGIGQLLVAGMSIHSAEESVREASSRTFLDPDVKITLEIAKPLSIFVLGNIPEPGLKIVPAFTRADQAIAGALLEPIFDENGNPLPFQTSRLLESNNYSLRNAEIHRANGDTVNIDLVSYFRAGDLSSNPILQTGDKITIEQMNRMAATVSVSGAVKRPNELEYLKGDTPADLIRIAGDYTTIADSTQGIIMRYRGGKPEKIIVEASDFELFALQPNDRLIIPEKPNWTQPATAWVSGEVNLPGNFPIQIGETSVAELLDLAGGTTDRALLSAAYLTRNGGQINEIPNKFNTELFKRTSDQLQQGFEYLDLEASISRERIYLDLNDRSQLESLQLFKNDRLYIPRDEGTVFVFGQVNDPGYYPIGSSGRSVNDFIKEAGDFALSADQERVFIIKAGSGTWYRPGQTTLESGDRIFIDRVPYDELNALRTYEVQKQQIRNTRIQLILTGLTTITSIITAYVAITRN